MEGFISMAKIDAAILEHMKELLALQIRMRDYAATPTTDNLEVVVQAYETSRESLESVKHVIASAVQEVNGKEIDQVDKIIRRYYDF